MILSPLLDVAANEVGVPACERDRGRCQPGVPVGEDMLFVADVRNIGDVDLALEEGVERVVSAGPLLAERVNVQAPRPTGPVVGVLGSDSVIIDVGRGVESSVDGGNRDSLVLCTVVEVPEREAVPVPFVSAAEGLVLGTFTGRRFDEAFREVGVDTGDVVGVKLEVPVCELGFSGVVEVRTALVGLENVFIGGIWASKQTGCRNPVGVC